MSERSEGTRPRRLPGRYSGQPRQGSESESEVAPCPRELLSSSSTTLSLVDLRLILETIAAEMDESFPARSVTFRASILGRGAQYSRLPNRPGFVLRA